MTEEKLFEHLENEVESYLNADDESGVVNVNEQGEGIRNLPVEVVGERKVPLDEIDFVNKLTPAQYEFALEYAFGGGKSVAQMAKDYGVQPITGYRWLRKPEVQALIAHVRSEHRAMALSQWLRLERKAFKAMEGVLDKKITSGNIDSIGRNAWNVIKEGLYLRGAKGNEGDENNDRAGLNVNVNVAGSSPSGQQTSGSQRGNYHGRMITNDDIEEVDREIRELEELDQVLDASYEEVEEGPDEEK